MPTENKVTTIVGESDGKFLCLLVTGFFVGQIFADFGVQAIFYLVVVLSGIVYVYRRPDEGSWVTFFLLAITSLIYPITVGDLAEPGAGEFRPYNFAILSITGAMVFGARHSRRHFPPTPPQKQPGAIKWSLALAGVFCLATLYGDLSLFKAEAIYTAQQSSSWISFFLFLWVGYKLALSPAQVRRMFQRFHSVGTVYSLAFLTRFGYLNYHEGLTAATDFAWGQRIGLFFAGCSLVVAFATSLAPEGKAPAKRAWLSALIIVPAVVLSGSRGVAGAVILTVFVLAATWRLRLLLRLTPLLLAALLIGVVVLRSHSEIIEEYVVSKFLISPELDPSFGGRVAEMAAVIEAVQRNPVLGSGTLASYVFFDPLFGWRETAFVDSGVGYLLLKTGLVGMSVFALFVLSYLKMLQRLRRTGAAAALIPMVVFVFYLAFLAFGSAFFDPRYSWLVGIQSGYSLYLSQTHNAKMSLWAMEIRADGNRSGSSYA